MRIALGVEYDGNAFCGWQTQPSGGAAQDALARALAAVSDSPNPIKTTAAGRTDAGVHAALQIVHFETTAKRPLSAWVRGANAHLPAPMSVLWAREVGETFHARHSAKWRAYRYILCNRPARLGLMAKWAGWHYAPLDVDAMNAAAAMLVGRRDFTSYRASSCAAQSPVRDLREAKIFRAGEWVVFDFCADGFLHHMVRNIVGALIYVGDQRHPPAWPREVLEKRHRPAAAPTFSPSGLYLIGAGYDEVHNLPESRRVPVLAAHP